MIINKTHITNYFKEKIELCTQRDCYQQIPDRGLISIIYKKKLPGTT